VDTTEISRLIGGFSGADIANLVNEATILSVRYNVSEITPSILFDAFEKISIGLPSQIESRSESILKMVAYHEMGHALVASMFPDLFLIQKVTIQSNKNGAGGYTFFLPKEPYDSYPSKKYLLANIMVSLGGRIAEKVFFKNSTNDRWFNPIQDLDITTGASNDLKQANSIARTYVNLFGNIGIYDGQDTNTPFLGREIAGGGSKLSEYSKEEIDKQIEQIVSFCYDRVEDMFNIYEYQLHDWSNELLKEKTLNQSFFN
jgi:cell division protease FtsH